MPTLKELFAAQGGKPITVDGRELHSNYGVPVNNGDKVKIDFLRSVPRPVQGLILAGNRCQLEVRGVGAKSIELWTNSAPKEVALKVVQAKAGATINIVNQWIDEKYGTTNHLNNAAIDVETQADGALLFRCSDGVGDADFEDLVFQVTIARQALQ